MQMEKTAPPGVMILAPRRFGDTRGFFSETWNRDRMSKAGFDIDFVQDNHSVSQRADTLRELHYQCATPCTDENGAMRTRAVL